jgi:RNA polymerase sigma-70 factor (ECF subfamily)
VNLTRILSCAEVGLARNGWAVRVGEVEWDAAEFERKLRECHPVVYRVAYGVLGDRGEAEDVAQDVFLRAYRKLSHLREAAKFRGWVARMSFRLALNRRRSRGRAERRDTSWMETRGAPAATPESIVAQQEFQAQLRERIDRLPEKLGAVLLLCAVEELNTREVAAVLGIPEGTVRSRLHLARKKLLEEFGDEAV